MRDAGPGVAVAGPAKVDGRRDIAAVASASASEEPDTAAVSVGTGVAPDSVAVAKLRETVDAEMAMGPCFRKIRPLYRLGNWMPARQPMPWTAPSTPRRRKCELLSPSVCFSSHVHPRSPSPNLFGPPLEYTGRLKPLASGRALSPMRSSIRLLPMPGYRSELSFQGLSALHRAFPQV